jgi:hypothetical protein
MRDTKKPKQPPPTDELNKSRQRVAAALEASDHKRLSAARLPNGQEQAGKEMPERLVCSQELAVVGKLAWGSLRVCPDFHGLPVHHIECIRQKKRSSCSFAS